MLIALITGVVYLAGLLALVCCALWAPEGYEDADGFHLGRPPQSPALPFISRKPAVDENLPHAA